MMPLLLTHQLFICSITVLLEPTTMLSLTLQPTPHPNVKLIPKLVAKNPKPTPYHIAILIIMMLTADTETHTQFLILP